MDMSVDVFAGQPYGKVALSKLKPASQNFRLYCAGWIETEGGPESWEVMEIKGAEFRVAKSGPNKGKLAVMVPGTKRVVHVHVSEWK